MIWFRRLSTLPLILIFIVLFITVLFVSQVNSTLGNPEFYNDQLRQADMYNFVYDEVMPAALDEIETDDSSGLALDISAIKGEVVSAARKILPPEWLQARVESATNALIPYILGSTDSFTYTVMLKDRVETATGVIKDDILQGDTVTNLYDDGMSYVADKIVENLDKLPYSLSLTKGQIESSLRTVVPKHWITSQVKAAIDSVTPYITGESNHFTITLQLGDRIDPMAEAVIDLISGRETYDYLMDEMIAPAIAANLGLVVNLPFEVSLSQEEIASAIKQVLPQSWVKARLDEVISGIAAYVKGEADSIAVTVNLADRKAVALDALTELADRKLEAMFYGLRVCSMAEFNQVVQNLPPGSLPDCRPSGISYEQFKAALNIDIAGSVDQMIGGQIPSQWVYTDADLKQSLGEDNEAFLDKARDWVSAGWTFTEADLVDKLGSDNRETLDDVRHWIESGYTLTETDLRDMIGDTGADLNIIDTVRHWTDTARTWLWTLWLIPLLLLLFIGLLGGRNWRSKLSWALVLLLVVSLAVYLGAGPIYSNIGEPRIEEIMLDPVEYEGAAAVIAEKGSEMIHNVTSTFASEIKSKMLYMMIGSGVVLLGVIAWSVLHPRRRSTPQQEEPSQGAV